MPWQEEIVFDAFSGRRTRGIKLIYRTSITKHKKETVLCAMGIRTKELTDGRCCE